LSETFLIIRRNERDVITNVHRASGAVDVIVVKFEFSQQIFEKCSNTKFHENPSRGGQVVPCGQTDGEKDGKTGRQT
jgi:hypothetical protein